jgi:flagellar basal-body rod protein FlgG
MASSLFQILNISRQDMLSRLLELDTTSNNLANVSTTGYKSQRSNFQELLQKAQLSGGRMASTQMLTGQGSFNNTGNALDLGIEGEGYFQMRTADGQTAYSRDGQFQLDSSLNIVNGSGQKLIWSGQIPATSEAVQVEPNGTVLTRTGTTWTQAGQIQLARFTNASGLLEKGQNLYLPSANSGPAQVGNPGTTLLGSIQAGQLEQSNVNSAAEMTNMILLQRDFDISTKVFQTTDTMIDQAIQMRRI